MSGCYYYIIEESEVSSIFGTFVRQSSRVKVFKQFGVEERALALESTGLNSRTISQGARCRPEEQSKVQSSSRRRESLVAQDRLLSLGRALSSPLLLSGRRQRPLLSLDSAIHDRWTFCIHRYRQHPRSIPDWKSQQTRSRGGIEGGLLYLSNGSHRRKHPLVTSSLMLKTGPSPPRIRNKVSTSHHSSLRYQRF